MIAASNILDLARAYQHQLGDPVALSGNWQLLHGLTPLPPFENRHWEAAAAMGVALWPTTGFVAVHFCGPHALGAWEARGVTLSRSGHVYRESDRYFVYTVAPHQRTSPALARPAWLVRASCACTDPQGHPRPCGVYLHVGDWVVVPPFADYAADPMAPLDKERIEPLPDPVVAVALALLPPEDRRALSASEAVGTAAADQDGDARTRGEPRGVAAPAESRRVGRASDLGVARRPGSEPDADQAWPGAASRRQRSRNVLPPEIRAALRNDSDAVETKRQPSGDASEEDQGNPLPSEADAALGGDRNGAHPTERTPADELTPVQTLLAHAPKRGLGAGFLQVPNLLLYGRIGARLEQEAHGLGWLCVILLSLASRRERRISASKTTLCKLSGIAKPETLDKLLAKLRRTNRKLGRPALLKKVSRTHNHLTFCPEGLRAVAALAQAELAAEERRIAAIKQSRSEAGKRGARKRWRQP